MIGYHNENAIKSNGKEWFATGDLGRMKADGFIEHLGRADDILNQEDFEFLLRKSRMLSLIWRG